MSPAKTLKNIRIYSLQRRARRARNNNLFFLLLPLLMKLPSVRRFTDNITILIQKNPVYSPMRAIYSNITIIMLPAIWLVALLNKRIIIHDNNNKTATMAEQQSLIILRKRYSMTIYSRFFTLLFFFCTVSLTDPAQAAKNQPMTITLPAPALHQAISDILPLPLEQNGKQFQGTITVDSISKLAINDNLISVQGQVSGKDMELTTNIGGQDIKLNLGKLVLPVTCDISLRYDPKKKTLFLSPKFQNPTHGTSNSAKTLLPLLNALGNHEYPVTLDTISPFNAKIGSKNVSVRMEPVDIRAGNNEMILKFRPVAGKNH